MFSRAPQENKAGRDRVMNGRSRKEAERIRDELEQIDRTMLHARRDWEKFVQTGDDAYLLTVS
jgi:hypothetical protein